MKNVKNGEVVSLIRKFLVSGIMIDNEYKESVIGTPQGGSLSPLLSNVVLNELDKELETRGLKFVRYANDSIILVHSSKAADRVMRNVSKFIENKLGLKVNMIIGWVNYYRIGNFKMKCKQIDSWLRFRIRMCIWKQWKTPQKRIKMMMKLGVSKNHAIATAYT
ncbi:MAG: reverse transcriptase domain-containing protein [Thomasclavelia sp.]|uniref:reverse transcriptase domain-containing protein n=1 Tax=Thomasclavelia sp. TaxID=3025757 RepID=UPI0039A0086C